MSNRTAHKIWIQRGEELQHPVEQIYEIWQDINNTTEETEQPARNTNLQYLQ